VSTQKRRHWTAKKKLQKFEAFCEHAQLATLLPLDEVIVLGDRKVPTEENQLAWLRLNVAASPQSAECKRYTVVSGDARWTRERPEHN
jgi:hypothetical protein